jgi:hypothetical protein
MRGLSRKTILLGAAAALVICVGASVLVTLPRSSSPLLQQTQISAQQPTPPVPQQSMPLPAPPPAQQQSTVPALQSTAPPPPTSLASPTMPEFPWPPPRASTWEVIPDALLVSSGRPAPTFGEIQARLSNALEAGGYQQRSFFAVPGGFALVTQVERVSPDGVSEREGRWLVARAPSTFSLESYLRQLLFAPQGRYRLVVFVITDVSFSASGGFITASEASDLAMRGANTLARDISAIRYSADHHCTALIYEFEKTNTDPQLVVPSRLPGREHLIRARIWAALTGTR